MKRLTVLYDARCAFCRRCRDWLAVQPSFLALEFLAIQSPRARRRFPGIVGSDPFGEAKELIVVSDEGGVYRSGDALLICLYALQDYRDLSLALANPLLKPMARRAFELVSLGRGWLSRLLTSEQDAQVDLLANLRNTAAHLPACDSDECRIAR